MWKDFKNFAFKGNIIDMAVGVIIGTAFSKIVSSLVNDIIMPLFGWLTSGMQFTDLKLMLDAQKGAAIMYGNFLQNIVDFLIIAFSIFFFTRFIGKAREKMLHSEPEPEPETKEDKPTTEELLAEIRDILKTKE